MKDKIFLDTNIFVYAFDKSKPAKMNLSRQLLFRYKPKENSVISYQVVQEFVNVCYKLNNSSKLTKATLNFIQQEMYSRWEINPSINLYNKAVEIKNKYKFSFYDSLIVAAAVETKCSTLFSEDFQNLQKIEFLQIVNPYVTR